MRVLFLVALLAVIAAVVVIGQRLAEPAPAATLPTPTAGKDPWQYAVEGAAGIGGLLIAGPAGANLALTGAVKAGA